jgi:ABC-2 type transport system permease protein
MKFLEIFRYEFNYQVRRPWPWLIALVLLFLNFLMTRDGGFAEALYSEFFLNSSFNVAKTTVFGGLLWLLMGGAIAGEAAARDVATGMHPLTYSMPIRKSEYLGGRFLAAFVVNAIILLSVQIAILLAVYLPGVAPTMIGPFRPAAFLTSYGFLSLPNALFATAIQFAFALRTGRPIAAYFASLLLFFIAFFVAAMLLFKRGLGTLLDPIGVRFIWEDLSHLWTTHEKSWRMLSLEGTILQNRLLWLGAGFATSAITYVRFQFAHRAPAASWWNRFMHRRNSKFEIEDPVWINPTAGFRKAETSIPTRIGMKSPTPIFGFRMHARQALAIAWTSFRTLATSWVGLFMLAFIPLLTVVVVIDQMVALGTPVVPITSRVIGELTGPLSAEMSRWVVIPGFIIFFAGELVWRERDTGVAEITDTMPGSDWVPLLAKFFGLCLVLLLFTTLMISAGMLAQTMMDYQKYEIDLYMKVMFGLQLTEYIIFAVLALAIHVVVDQKYVGHLVAIIAYAFIAALATMLGIEHNMLIYGAGPAWSFTEMRGFQGSIAPWLWFKLYWVAWALLIMVIARVFLVRGKEKTVTVRMGIARRRFTPPTTWLAGAAVLLIITIGGFVFYNTNILHQYRSKEDVNEVSAEYEQRYGKYENIRQPQLAAVKLRLDIFSRKQEVRIRGSYRLVNNTIIAIDSIHVAISSGGAQTVDMAFDRTAKQILDDKEHHYRIYALEKPLNPGDTLVLDFDVQVKSRGFSNGGASPWVMEGGSFFTNRAWFPSIGYQRDRSIINPGERQKYGLAPRPVLASLYEGEGAAPTARGGGIMFEAVISTDEGQVAVVPGKLLRAWTDPSAASGQRGYFHYATDAPIGSEWSFFSANYKVLEEEWISPDSMPVMVRIFHHPQHTAHPEHMMKGIKAALDYYTKEFGPYLHSHLTVVENPLAPGNGMHADASMIYYGQGYAFWMQEDSLRLDFPYAVMGHEMGHQWTLPYALVEGLPFLAEGLAWYYSIMMVKATRGEEQVRRLLSFMRLPYPYQPIRRGEPLLRAMDPWMSHRKGPFAMYALTEYAGSDRVNGALRRLVETSDSAGASSVTTLDLHRELKAVIPDSLQYLLHDLFEVNAYWDLEVQNVTAVENKGAWQVTLDVKARKLAYDSAGVVTETPMDEWIPIGVFAARERGHDELSAPLYMQMHRIRTGEQKITVTVRREPVLAGIDPYHLLDMDEKEDDDNVDQVTITN